MKNTAQLNLKLHVDANTKKARIEAYTLVDGDKKYYQIENDFRGTSEEIMDTLIKALKPIMTDGRFGA